MHEVVHVGVLGFTILGAASLALVVLWPALFDSPMPASAKGLAAAAVAVAGLLLIVEWQLVH